MCCGTVPPRLCAQLAEHSDTKVQELPEHESGQVPVEYVRAEPRYYGVTPTTLVLVLAVAALAAAIVLLVTGRWPVGLILLGVGVLLLLVFLEAGRREALAAFRARAGVAADSFATRGRAARRLLGLRRELQRMAVLRTRLLFELGDAVYRGDEQATEKAREQVKELDELTAQREGEMQEVVARAHERLHQRKLEVQPTVAIELPEEPAAPGEQDPSGPAIVPEPYPPPNEGDPPQPAIIPEPGPAVIPEPGPIGPEERKD